MMGFAMKGLKVIYFIIIFIFIAVFIKYMYGQYTGEIITEDFVIEDKEVLKESSIRDDDKYIIIADDIKFEVNKDEYNEVEIGDRVQIKYNEKTLFVKKIVDLDDED